MKKIKTSIIIPTYNKLLLLKIVLKSLEGQITDDVEVIIVFDGCEEKMIEDFHKLTFSFQTIEVICPNNIGRARARNKGIEKAKGDVVIFLDDDRIVSPDYVRVHVQLHEAGFPVVLGKRKEFYLSDDEIEKYYKHHEKLSAYCEEKGEIEEYIFSKKPKSILRWLNFFTGNVSVDRSYLIKVKGFDEAFTGWGHEDIDLGLRISQEGAAFIYTDDAINYHMMHGSNFTNKTEQSVRNLKYMLRKYRKHLGVQFFLYALIFKQYLFGRRISKKQQKKYELHMQS